MTEFKPPKEGSRKAKIYAAFNKGGLEAAYKRADELGIAQSSVKSWSATWFRARGEEPPKADRKAGGPKKPVVIKRARLDDAPERGGPFDPHFRHTSRERAQRHIKEISANTGISPKAYKILEENGRFAVAPLTYKPTEAPPQFKNGDVVFDLIIPNTRAKVIAAGPQQTHIRYDKESPRRPREAFVPNYYLYKFDGKADDKPAIKRERGASKAEPVKRERISKKGK